MDFIKRNFFPIDINQAIIAIKNKDQKGLGFLYDRYGNTLLGIINRMLNDPETSEEILQETFIKIWDKAALYNEKKSTPFTWMLTIARNNAIDKMRLKSFQNQNKTDSLEINVHQGKEDQQLSEKIDAFALSNSLEQKYKDVLDLIYLQGFTQKEAAEHLGLPIGTIKTRVKKAIDLLRDKLKGERNLFVGLFMIVVIIGIWTLMK